MTLDDAAKFMLHLRYICVPVENVVTNSVAIEVAQHSLADVGLDIRLIDLLVMKEELR